MFHGADTGQLQDFAQRLGESSGRTSELLDEATTWRPGRGRPEAQGVPLRHICRSGTPCAMT